VLTPRQLALIASSWDAIALHRADAARQFYIRLLEGNPELRPMFERLTDEARVDKFIAMMDAIVGLRHEPLHFVRVAADLGRRHAEYGVLSDHYTPTGWALLDALESVLGDAFKPDLREAWSDAFLLFAALMSHAAVPRCRGPGVKLRGPPDLRPHAARTVSLLMWPH
jgi:hemoglobin-like flavoprotein